MPFPLSFRFTGVFISAIPIAGIAAIKKVTVTWAPLIGLPSVAVSFTRKRLPPLCGGLGSVVSSAFVWAWFIAAAPPAPGGGGVNAPAAACSWLSESIRKLAD